MGSIHVSNLGKAYRHYPTRWSRLAEWVLPGPPRHQQHWVIRDVSFDIAPGEAVGIIGMNGAGKSTLLKMITGTTQPTSGQVRMTGRVAAMLELGMGFHPDFTGRQNVLMAGQLLGLSLADLHALMPSIEAFAEIGPAIDEPVRVYSSGMQMRLAFSVATAARPDILIVDEALSVGDAYFQHKSFQRIREFRNQGTTLLIVSHDKSAIQSICNRAILLDGGRVAMEGDPEAVMDYYNAILAGHQGQKVEQSTAGDGKVRTTSGTGEATVSRISLLDAQGAPVEYVSVGEQVRLQFEVDVREPIDRLVLGFSIKDRLGQVMYGTNTDLTGQPLEHADAGDRIVFEARFRLDLGIGTYSVQVALVSTETHLVNNYEWRDLAMIFHVVNPRLARFEGCNWLDARFEITRASTPEPAMARESRP